jgi:hypothetical protein
MDIQKYKASKKNSKDEVCKSLREPSINQNFNFKSLKAQNELCSSDEESDEPNLNKLDMLACVGYQVRLGHIAIQSLLKYGFININNGLL